MPNGTTIIYNGTKFQKGSMGWVGTTGEVNVIAQKPQEVKQDVKQDVDWTSVFWEHLTGKQHEPGSSLNKAVQELNTMSPEQRMNSLQNSKPVKLIDGVQRILVRSRFGVVIPSPSTLARAYVDPNNTENQVIFAEEMKMTEQSIVKVPGKKNSKSAPNEKSEPEPLRLYRSVSHEEYKSLTNPNGGKFEPNGMMEQKWFAEKLSDAVTWGEKLNGSGNYRIISIEIKDGVVKNLEKTQQIFSVQRLDGIGPAKAIDYRTLNEIKPKIQTEK